jgi:hypothetical protein
MDENKWHNRIMHLTSFSLGVILTALAISRGLFNLMLYVIIGSIAILLFSFVYNYIRGIDYMTQNHPDYTGDDLFGEEDNTETNKFKQGDVVRVNLPANCDIHSELLERVRELNSKEFTVVDAWWPNTVTEPHYLLVETNYALPEEWLELVVEK